MSVQRCLAAAFAAGLVALLGGCGGSDESRADMLLVSTRDGEYAVYGLNADGGGQHRLTDEDIEPSSPAALFFQVEAAWSPDGERIVFASKRGGSFDLYVMNADGTGTRSLTSGPQEDSNPTWSPDGARIAFQRGPSGDLYVVDADGSDAHAISDEPAAESQPAWSPDGRWIAHVRRTPGTESTELWLVRPDGTQAHTVTSYGSATQGPAWAPSSRRIAFSADLDGSVFDIYSVDLDGKARERHTQSSDDAFEPSWSPDGRTIAFSRGGAIGTVDLDGQVETITDAENNDSSPAWNPSPSDED